ncbi:MAG: NAD(P)/FAD-dependent oxidoreductase [Acidobacteria bacterium]|nr:MAG: NAD(P)/FAD-dependent oxidoreductase [Acidobacteriota bacterium]
MRHTSGSHARLGRGLSAQPSPHRVVILGGGFGGIFTARTLRRVTASISLVDGRNFHLFQPLLYQVATGGLSPANIATPLRSIFKRQHNLRVIMAEASGFDLAGRRLLLRDGPPISYDTLVVAAGSRHQYFGNDGWEAHAPGLKTLEDAMEIRRRILSAFEEAEREQDPAQIRRLLTFVVIGAGPTGVELAGALAEIARQTLRHEFRTIDPSDAYICLVEGADRILPTYLPRLSARAKESLGRLGVTVMTNTIVTSVSKDSVTLQTGETVDLIPTRTVLWAAGIQASPLAGALANQSGTELDRTGRVVVESDLTLPGHSEVLIVGDMAHFAHNLAQPLPAMAPVAMQQGRYAARVIRSRVDGSSPPGPFRYREMGKMATIGRAAAVAELGRLHFSGFLAWLIWLFVHLLNLVGFANRLLVLLQWAIRYITWNRSARLITKAAWNANYEAEPPSRSSARSAGCAGSGERDEERD